MKKPDNKHEIDRQIEALRNRLSLEKKVVGIEEKTAQHAELKVRNTETTAVIDATDF